jgi:AcrR family transcriptional regulator
VADALSARERILATAYELFTRRGVNDVGVDEVVENAAVAKTTLYRHFPSKEDLVLAFLEERERLWKTEVIDRNPRSRTDDPEFQILAIFQELDDWFHRRADYEACSFMKVLLEAGLRDTTSLARELNILIRGASFALPRAMLVQHGGPKLSRHG